MNDLLQQIVCLKYGGQITQVGTSESCYCLLVQTHHIFDMGNHHIPLLHSNICTRARARPTSETFGFYVCSVWSHSSSIRILANYLQSSISTMADKFCLVLFFLFFGWCLCKLSTCFLQQDLSSLFWRVRKRENRK